jgi:hypothetical protein
MRHYFKTLAVVTIVLVLPLFAYSQTSTGQDSQSPSRFTEPITGHHEAVRMVRALAELMRPLDAKKDQSGSAVQAKLVQKVTFTDGTELPKDTFLIGEVTVDDMQEQGVSKLALRFNQARLKNGTVVGIKATIVGFYGPGAGDSQIYPVEAGDQVPNSWTDGTLQLDQINVVADVDLHSKISSGNSGVFVSTKKGDVKLKEGSEIQFAIGPGQGGQNSAMSNAGQGIIPAPERK